MLKEMVQVCIQEHNVTHTLQMSGCVMSILQNTNNTITIFGHSHMTAKIENKVNQMKSVFLFISFYHFMPCNAHVCMSKYGLQISPTSQ